MMATKHVLDAGPVTAALQEAKKRHLADGERRYIVYRGEKVTIAKSLRKTVGRYWMIANGNLSMVVPGWAKGES